MLGLFLRIWYVLPMGWRYVLMVVPIVAGIIVSLVMWNWWPCAVGPVISAMLFLLPGPSEAEKKGYRF